MLLLPAAAGWPALGPAHPCGPANAGGGERGVLHSCSLSLILRPLAAAQVLVTSPYLEQHKVQVLGTQLGMVLPSTGVTLVEKDLTIAVPLLQQAGGRGEGGVSGGRACWGLGQATRHVNECPPPAAAAAMPLAPTVVQADTRASGQRMQASPASSETAPCLHSTLPTSAPPHHIPLHPPAGPSLSAACSCTPAPCTTPVGGGHSVCVCAFDGSASLIGASSRRQVASWRSLPMPSHAAAARQAQSRASPPPAHLLGKLLHPRRTPRHASHAEPLQPSTLPRAPAPAPTTPQ